MSVAKVKTGWKVRYRDHSGNAKSETYTLKGDALARDAAIKQAKQRREPIPARGRGDSGQTFEDFAMNEWWPEDVVGRRLAPKTQTSYAELLDGHLIPRVGADAVAFIDVQRVIDLRAQLAADGVPDYTSARALKLFRQVLEFATLKGRLPFNPAQVLSGKKALPSQKRTTDVRPIAPEVTEALRANILKSQSPYRQRDAVLVSLIAYAGLRPEEALALTWENVKKDSIRVEHANADGVIGRTKTEYRRTVRKLIPALVDDIDAWRAKLTAQTEPERHRAATGAPKPGDLVVAQPDGSPWTRSDYANFRRRVFKKWLPDDAPANARVYDLRHGYASLLIREGLDLATVAHRMGNSPTTTAAHYTHVFEEYGDEKAKAMAATVAAARRSRGHFEDTFFAGTQGRRGKPSSTNPRKIGTSRGKRVPA